MQGSPLITVPKRSRQSVEGISGRGTMLTRKPDVRFSHIFIEVNAIFGTPGSNQWFVVEGAMGFGYGFGAGLWRVDVGGS